MSYEDELNFVYDVYNGKKDIKDPKTQELFLKYSDETWLNDLLERAFMDEDSVEFKLLIGMFLVLQFPISIKVIQKFLETYIELMEYDNYVESPDVINNFSRMLIILYQKALRQYRLGILPPRVGEILFSKNSLIYALEFEINKLGIKPRRYKELANNLWDFVIYESAVPDLIKR